MKKRIIAVVFFTVAFITGCGSAANTADTDTIAVDSVAAESVSEAETEVATGDTAENENADASENVENQNTEALPNLAVRFGETDDRPVYEIALEDNEVSLQFVRVLQQSEQTIPIYVFDGSEHTDVMQYYDIPARYEIPDGEPVSVESQLAGEVYYSAPSRIMIFFRDGEVPGDYVKVGTVTTTEGLEDAVNSNPLDAWGNKRVIISVAE